MTNVLRCSKVKTEKGFTLIELLVAMTVFLVIIGAASGLFVSAIMAQRRTLTLQELLDQTSYVMEYMSRALRMAQKESNAGVCLSSRGLNYEKTRSGRGLKFINANGICQEFFWDSNNQLKESKTGTEEYLTSAGLEIIFFKIDLSGESQTDDIQPRVTVFLDIKGKVGKPESRPEIKIQTTVSQRNLDIQY